MCKYYLTDPEELAEDILENLDAGLESFRKDNGKIKYKLAYQILKSLNQKKLKKPN